MTTEPLISSASIADLSNPVTILALGCTADDRTSLGDMSLKAGWRVIECAGVEQALPLLDARSVRVVLCGEHSPWQDILEFGSGRKDPPIVIVVARHADDALWAEVLSLGAFDLLESPLQWSETIRVIACAWLHAKLEHRTPTQPGVPVMRATA